MHKSITYKFLRFDTPDTTGKNYNCTHIHLLEPIISRSAFLNRLTFIFGPITFRVEDTEFEFRVLETIKFRHASRKETDW